MHQTIIDYIHALRGGDQEIISSTRDTIVRKVSDDIRASVPWLNIADYLTRAQQECARLRFDRTLTKASPEVIMHELGAMDTLMKLLLFAES